MNVHMWCVGRARLPFTEGSLSSLAYLVAAAVVAFGLLLCMEAGLGLCVKGISALVPCEFDGIWDPDWIGCPVLLKKWKLCLRAGALILQLYDVEPIIRLKMPRLIQLVPPSRASATSHPGRKTERNIVGSIIWVSDILGLGQISCTIESHPFSVLSFFFFVYLFVFANPVRLIGRVCEILPLTRYQRKGRRALHYDFYVVIDRCDHAPLCKGPRTKNWTPISGKPW